MSIRVGAWPALSVAAVLLICGCGGGSGATDTSTAPPSTMTRAEFLKKGNALCLGAEKARGRVIQSAVKRLAPGAKLTSSEQEALIKIALVPYKRLAKELEGLGPPAKDVGQVRAIAKALESGVGAAQGDPAVAIRSSSQFAEFDRLAVKFGLDACQI